MKEIKNNRNNYKKTKTHKKSKTKLNKNILKKGKNTQKGGKFIGKGSFGCVIKPALSCNNSDINFDKKVSKIIKSLDDDFQVKNELYISKLLKNIDPKKKYFLYINNSCKLLNIPNTRSNIVKVNEYSNSRTNKIQYQILNSKKIHNNEYCPVDLNKKPMNLILDDGGKDLYDLADYFTKNFENHDKMIINDNLYITMYKLLLNIKKIFKHLLEGLKLLHSNNIVQRDIKEENIMALYNPKTNNLNVRFVDFGMSEKITPNMGYNNIRLSGSSDMIAPEIFIIHYYCKYANNINKAQEKINDKIQKHTFIMFEKLKLMKSTNIFNTEINNLYTYIGKLFANKEIIKKYFGYDKKYNGYLFKSDIYSLGISIIELLRHFTNNYIDIDKHPLLLDLLTKMITINPEKRPNVIECLNHPYFTS